MTTANEELQSAYQEWQALTKRIVELQRKGAGEEVSAYDFKTPEGSATLSDLFGGRDELMVVHNMGKSCVYCTLWADVLNGMVAILEDRAAFAVVSPDPPAIQHEFAQSRNWNFTVASAEGTMFIEDMGYGTKESPTPGYSCFAKAADGSITRSGHAPFGPGDPFCPPWHLFELLPNGINGWEPKYQY